MGDWELLLLLWCLLAIATGVVTLIAENARKRRRHLNRIDTVAHSKRVVSMNAYRTRMGVNNGTR